MDTPIINEGKSRVPTNNPGIKFNIPMITPESIKLIHFPKIKKAKFNKEDSGDIIFDNDNNIKDIDSKELSKMSTKELKITANKLGIFDTKGGDERIILKIREKLKAIENCKTI